jgi:hypothetical protein
VELKIVFIQHELKEMEKREQSQMEINEGSIFPSFTGKQSGEYSPEGSRREKTVRPMT